MLSAIYTPRSLNPLQSFGAASLIIIVGVLSSWVYLKRSSETPTFVMPEFAPVQIQPEEASPGEAATWVQFGEEAYAEGRIIDPAEDNALYFFQRALAEAPKNADALGGLDRVLSYLANSAESAIYRGDWLEARQHAEKLLALRPGDTVALTLQSRIKRFEDLESLISKANSQLAVARLTEPADDNALATYRSILELDPENSVAKRGIQSIAQLLLGYAQSAALAGENGKAQAFVAKVRNFAPDAKGLAEVEQIQKQWDQMASNQQVQDLLKSAADAMQAGQLSEPDEPNALALFNAVLELQPDSEAARHGKGLVIRALLDRAWSEIGAGNFQAARGPLNQARKAGASRAKIDELQEEIDYQAALAKARSGEFDNLISLTDLEVRNRGVPDFPKEAAEDGWVVIHFTVSEEGEVVDPDVLESSDQVFDESALKAIRRWRFRPYTVDGRPMPVRSRVKFEFKA